MFGKLLMWRQINMDVNVSGVATGIFAVIIAMLVLSVISTPISPSTSNTLLDSGIALGFLVVIGSILTKLR